MSIVVDASMTICWILEDEKTEQAHAVLKQIALAGAFVPQLWRLEVANMMRNAVRRKRCDDTFADLSLSRLELLPITIDPETAHHAWRTTRILSRRYDLTIYDAAYLELALRRRLPLASCDDDLIAAATACGVPVVTA